MLLVTMKQRALPLSIYTLNKMIAIPLTNPIPYDAFKAHMLSLRICKVQCLGCLLLCGGHVSFVKSIYVMKVDVSFLNVDNLLSHIRLLECHMLPIGLVT